MNKTIKALIAMVVLLAIGVAFSLLMKGIEMLIGFPATGALILVFLFFALRHLMVDDKDITNK